MPFLTLLVAHVLVCSHIALRQLDEERRSCGQPRLNKARSAAQCALAGHGRDESMGRPIASAAQLSAVVEVYGAPRKVIL